MSRRIDLMIFIYLRSYRGPLHNIYLGRRTFKCPIENCGWEGQTRSGRSKHIRRIHGPVRQDEAGSPTSGSSLPATPVGHLSVRVRDPQGTTYRGVIHRAPRAESTLVEPEGETLSDFTQGSELDNAQDDPNWEPE